MSKIFEYDSLGSDVELANRIRPSAWLKDSMKSMRKATLLLLAAVCSQQLLGQRQPEPPARPICLVPVGAVPQAVLDHLTAHCRERFGVALEVLPALSFDRATYDANREQLVAEEVIDAIRQRYPTRAANTRTLFIGITPDDMYGRGRRDWRFVFGWRRASSRAAVISYARMDPINLGMPADETLLRTRLRKMLTRYLGVLYYGMSFNQNAKSVLYASLLGLEELDYMGEEF